MSPPGSIGLATGGSLSATYAGVIVTPPAFAALHGHFGLSYGSAFALLSLVTALGVGCIVLARHAYAAAGSAAHAGPGDS